MSTHTNPIPVAINFMGARKIAAILSIVLLLGSIVSLFVKQLPLGFDFVGGLQVDAIFEQPVDVEQLRTSLEDNGFANASVVYFGSDKQVKFRLDQPPEDIVSASLVSVLTAQNKQANEILVENVPPRTNKRLSEGGTLVTFRADNVDEQALTLALGEQSFNISSVESKDGQYTLTSNQDLQNVTFELFLNTLNNTGNGEVSIQEIAFLSSNIGKELRDEGGLGLLVALLAVMIYVAVRFQFKFSVGAVSALIHDVIIVLGFFSILGIDFDLTVLAALLAVIGYSLNDTIVVADRIRENFRLMRKGSPTDIINVSLNQTLGRTTITSLTTLIVLVVMYTLGGDALRGFSIALIVGIIVGTYSSIYVSANILLAMNISKEDLIKEEKEGGELLDDMP